MPPMLEVEGIDTFYGEAHILHGVSLTADAGEVVALLGRNGAGKTTTLKSVMGLVRVARGRITYRGEDITGRESFEICRRGIGYVPEERRIFKQLTVMENLMVGERAAPEGREPWTVERLFELFPNLAARRSNMGGQLSGGEQQMLTIARTLMGNPDLVLLDEPSEGIAPIIVEQMARSVMELKKSGLSVVLSEQNLNFARLVSDRAAIIESGEMRYAGTMAELEAHPEVRERYLAAV